MPAERTSIIPLDRLARNPAAIWDLPAFRSQTKRTEGLLAGSAVMAVS
jgi:hypothetical protein